MSEPTNASPVNSPQLPLIERTWRLESAKTGGFTPGMLGFNERKLMFHIAKDYLSGAGAVVDLGAFCGGSAVTFAAGLELNPLCADTMIHSYDLFIADSDYMIRFSNDWMPTKLIKGESFEPVFREIIAPHADRIVVHAGDLFNETWTAGAIELLFVDAAKTRPLSSHIFAEFFPALIPGRSVVLHQDFFSPPIYWIAVQMDALMDYFTIIEERMDFTVAFRLDREIPAEILKRVTDYNFTFQEELAALGRFKERLGSEGWPTQMLECALYAATPGKKQTELPIFTDEQRADSIFAGNAAFLQENYGISL